MNRANYIGAPEMFNLNHACRSIAEAFDEIPYLVGSALEKRDFRDVDIRLMLPDAEFERLFGKDEHTNFYNGLWSLFNASLSEWLGKRTGLPVDFQIQKRSAANKEYEGQRRSAIGIFIVSKK